MTILPRFPLPSLLSLVFAAAVSGCITTEDRRVLDDIALRGYSRAEVDALNAAMVCRDLARNMVQIARCNR